MDCMVGESDQREARRVRADRGREELREVVAGQAQRVRRGQLVGGAGVSSKEEGSTG